MTQRRCHDIEALIDREAHGWSEAERLHIEQHLETCEGCRETLSVARFVRSSFEAIPVRLGETARTRAIARALDAQPRAQRAAPRRKLVWGLSGGVAAAAAAALLLWLWPSPHDSQPLARAPEAPPAVVVAEPGDQATARAPLPASEPTWIETHEKSTRSFAHAVVALDADTRVRFDEATTTLSLERGRVDVDVDVTQGRSFSVTTQHFRVQVLGTLFTVTPDSVVVQRGRVQVFGLDGDVLARDLGAGSTFSYREPAPRPEPSSATGSARSWLGRARESLLAGNVKAAQAHIATAEQSRLQRADRAEAATLRAEIALLERDPAAALRLYRGVADRYADLVAGENAAFAAAQLAARIGAPDQSELLRRYLERYPRGRFADEVKQRLAR